MMLGRLAAVSRAAAARSAALTRARGFATAAPPAYPKTLSVRMDGLMVKCLIAAIVYFVPQDLVFLSGLFWKWHADASAISPKAKQADAEAAVDEWKAKKGLTKAMVDKGRSTWYVSV